MNIKHLLTIGLLAFGLQTTFVQVPTITSFNSYTGADFFNPITRYAV